MVILVKLFHGFLYTTSNTWLKIYALKDNAPGPIYFANVNRQNFHASFWRHYLDFFALIPLKKLFVARRTDYQMACWHIRDTRKKSRTNLQGKHLPTTWNYTGSHLTQMFFWHVFGSMGFLQLEEEKFTNWKISVTVYWKSSRQARNQNR